MKKFYFISTNGTSGSIIPIKYSKDTIKAVEQIFRCIDDLNLPLNMAIAITEKEADNLLEGWL